MPNLTDTNRKDEGFTLIELMVVVLIIAILLAIAIPTFLGARGQANSRAAQSSLRNALTAEQTYYTNNQAFDDTSAGTSGIASIEPNLTWVSSTAAGKWPASSPNTITVTLVKVTNASDSVLLQTMGKDGKCYSVWQSNGTVPATGLGTAYNVSSSCSLTVGGLTGLSNSTATTPPTIGSGTASNNVGGANFYANW